VNRVVLHYHEIALKGGNRRAFVRQLVENLRRGLRGTGVHRVRSTPGRIVIALQKRADWPEMKARLGRTFGIANFAPALRTEPDLDAMRAGVLQLVDGRSFGSFAVRTKRADKGFPMMSPDISRVLGAAVKEATGVRVDLKHPELTITVELLHDAALVSAEKIVGPGGLPVGTAGAVLALLSGGIDSPVAAARMMQRGCRAELLHFHAVPFQDRRGIEKARELAEVLTRFQYSSRLHLVPFGEIQRDIVAHVPRPYRVVLYRRMMLRIAEALAGRLGCAALVTGESLGQVASQTLGNLVSIEDAVRIPVLRPLIGMDKQEITAQAERLGTYEISVQPDQDCCQLFVPPHPATHLPAARARKHEEGLPLDDLIRQALERVEVAEYEFPRSARANDE
jgi:thiamine biosynthesis protein ThiI